MTDRQFDTRERSARAVVRDGRAVHEAVETMLAAPEQARLAARRAYEAVRDEIVAGELGKLPVDRLREITQGKVQLIPVRQAGLTTVGQVLAAGPGGLERVPGVDEKAAGLIIAAASQTRESVAERTRVRLDPDARTRAQTELTAVTWPRPRRTRWTCPTCRKRSAPASARSCESGSSRRRRNASAPPDRRLTAA